VDHPGLHGAQGGAVCKHERGARLVRQAAGRAGAHRRSALTGRVRAAVGSPAAAGALGPRRGQAVAVTRAGGGDDQGEDRAEQQADGRGGKGDRLHGQGGRLPDTIPPGGHLLPGGHRLACGELAEYAQHLGKRGVRPEQVGLDAVKLVLLVVAKTHDMLLNCGIAVGADLKA
jgi:hypothetical protein